MTNWEKLGIGPGTDTCARCLGSKDTNRRRSKWCRACDDYMRRKPR